MRLRKHLNILIGTTLLLTSCSTPKNISYFQELNNGAIVDARQIMDVKVKPEDKLSIVVSTQEPALSSLFNLVTTQNNVGGFSSGGNQVSYYTVDSSGDIIFPVIGKIRIAGLSREQVAEKISKELISRNLVKDPIVTVEFANAAVAVLGEVKSPGRYSFNEDHLTVIDAIAMAGDLTINGQRDNILVMRKVKEGTQEAYRVNLLNAQELMSSPAFYLQQDDIVYVEPDDKKKREATPNGNSPYTASFWISMGSFAITIATFIITLSK